MSEAAGIRLDITGTEAFLPPGELDAMAAAVNEAAGHLEAQQGPGSDYMGWVDLPDRITDEQLRAFEESAARAREDAELYVVVGIGGSYLGARAVLDALRTMNGAPGPAAPEVLFAGTGLCSASLHRILKKVADRDFRICVISKSGTTLEPAVAFRTLRAILQERYGRQEAARRIIAVTDANRGALRTLADQEGYESYVIPDNVGGRFSVLTPVGLAPLAAAGVDIRALVAGAREMRAAAGNPDLRANPAHLYAAARGALYGKGFTTEVMSTFHSDLQTVQEWWKQLFGESRREIQETFLCVRRSVEHLAVPGDDADLDGLNYLAGRSLDEINWKAYEGTRKAHGDGGVPTMSLEIDTLTPEVVGALLYMFEKAVGVSGRLLAVNPFDQPGVEAYKKEMFRLLGKPA